MTGIEMEALTMNVRGSEASAPPWVTVVIPARNAGNTLDACLQAVWESSFHDIEVIVVDDGSEDDITAICRRYRCTVLRQSANRMGVGAARQYGLDASRSPYVFFTDADVCLAYDAIAQGVQFLETAPRLAAAVGSYSTDCGQDNLLSRYKQFLLHQLHQDASGKTCILTGCCSIVRRNMVVEAGGFATSGRFALILEDAELGLRMTGMGHQIALLPSMQASHLKRYTFWRLVKSDLLGRAAPWTVLMWTHRKMTYGLTNRWQDPVAAACVCLFPLAACIAVLRPLATVLLALWLTSIWHCVAFLCRRLGWRRLPLVLALRWIDYLVSIVGLMIGTVMFLFDRITAKKKKPCTSVSSGQVTTRT